MPTRTTRRDDKHRADEAFNSEFAADVQYYLAQDPRQLPSRYFYDELGSALFEAICRLPWYRVTRSESLLLATHGATILQHVPHLSAIVELGSGSGEKLRTLIESAEARPASLDVHLVDLSGSALGLASQVLAPVDRLRVMTHKASYEAGLRAAMRQTSDAGPTLVLFLGSNIGNFDAPAAEAFLWTVRANMAAGDALLLGADLVKPEQQLLLAYDDPLGVTAAFNRNLLVRINGELGGNFAIEQFDHRAVWNAAECRVEMHLVALSPQRVHVRAAQTEVQFLAGETIWTESSYKYEPAEVARLLEETGFRVASQWIEGSARFALTLGDAV